MKIKGWPERALRGGKRANVTMDLGYYDHPSDGPVTYVPFRGSRDWFEGFGKSEECRFEGTWWDMICFARNVLASPNTELAAPEFFRPEWKNDNYTGPRPYDYEDAPDTPLAEAAKDKA